MSEYSDDQRMTTANSAETVPDLSRFTISVRALKAAQRIPTRDVCAVLHMSHATFYERMSDHAWKLEHAVALADLFGTTVHDMLSGIGGKSSAARDGKTTQPYLRPNLSAITNKTPHNTPRSGQLTLHLGGLR